MISASEQKREDVEKQREEWKEFQPDMLVKKLVFLDESGVNINMTRRYGRAKGKERVHDYVRLSKPKNTTLISSVRLDGTLAYEYFQGAVNKNIFLDYIKNALIPTLHEGDIVVMDNLRCHKTHEVEKELAKAGVRTLFLPPYSPDLNPIEMMWSKIKALLRKWKANTSDLLNNFIPLAFQAVSINDITGWFSESGYSCS